MQQAYYQRSVYNLVRIILGLPELFDEPGVNDVYTRAAQTSKTGSGWAFCLKRANPASSLTPSGIRYPDPRTRYGSGAALSLWESCRNTARMWFSGMNRLCRNPNRTG